MGARSGRRLRLYPTGQRPLSFSKSGADGYGRNMDTMVFHYQAKEYAVRLPLSLALSPPQRLLPSFQVLSD